MESNTITAEQTASIRAMVEGVDEWDLAAKSNTITGGWLRGEDAAKIAVVIAESAMRQPGREVNVAGFIALHDSNTLTLSVGEEVVSQITIELTF